MAFKTTIFKPKSERSRRMHKTAQGASQFHLFRKQFTGHPINEDENGKARNTHGSDAKWMLKFQRKTRRKEATGKT